MANNSRDPLKRQNSFLPEPKSPNREDNCLTRDAIEKESDEEYVFSAVAAVMEKQYDEEIILYAITGKKPMKAKNANSKKEDPIDCGANVMMLAGKGANVEADSIQLDGQASRRVQVESEVVSGDSQLVENPKVQRLRRSTRERLSNSRLKEYLWRLE